MQGRETESHDRSPQARYTPPTHTYIMPFTPSPLLFTPLIHTYYSHLLFTPPIHTSYSHLMFTPPIHAPYSHHSHSPHPRTHMHTCTCAYIIINTTPHHTSPCTSSQPPQCYVWVWKSDFGRPSSRSGPSVCHGNQVRRAQASWLAVVRSSFKKKK